MPTRGIWQLTDGNDDLSSRIASYELAYKMQTTAPEAVDLSTEDAATLEMYGCNNDRTRDFGTRCLLARRLVERGVRFIQLYTGGAHNDDNWDAHGDLEMNHNKHAGNTDQPIAALLADLKQRGMLDETLVVWGGEFGRQPTAEYASGSGRDHNSYGFTMWMAGGGIKGGVSYGTTDELGSRAVENPLARQEPSRHDSASTGTRSQPPVVLLQRPGSEAGRRRTCRTDSRHHRLATALPFATSGKRSNLPNASRTRFTCAPLLKIAAETHE